MSSKQTIQIWDIEVEVTRKRVKNLNIRIYPSAGRVAMSIPRRCSLRTAELFAKKKYKWIKKHLNKRDSTDRQKVHKSRFISGETHNIWGTQMPMRVELIEEKPGVILSEEEILLHTRPGSSREKRESVLNEWYRSELKKRIPVLIKKWEKPMGVNVNEFGVKRMKTRWGTCNIRAKRIWLNLELAKRDPACLEYVVVHEMVHLLERLHSKRFYRLMDHFLPDWRERDLLLKGKRLTC
ncbi:M48 family metallopeptidase [Rhodohalobacter halophilus]|uniref:M48 family metallopeptidase n=1 Tax=Rhodohalobacter halophilus TaxID=1812810 RepID=UPI00083FA357|nr:SprT family zinc-dependent metalloprotease [Rhodohalobacter halophilus]